MARTIQLEIVQKIQETNDTVTLQLRPLVENFTYQAGQSITLIFNNLSAKSFRRSYSFSTAPSINKLPAITIKRQVNGLASTYLTKDIKVGDQLTALDPAGQFILTIDPNKKRDIVLFGGGSGITPLFAILKQTLRKETRSVVTLVLANSSKKKIIFKKQLEQWAKQFPKRLKIIYLISDIGEEVDDLKGDNIQVLQQRLSNYLVEKLVKKILHFAPNNAQFFICGPEGLLLKTSMTLHFMGFTKAQVHQEVFIITNPIIPDPKRFINSQVSLKYQNTIHQFPVQAGQTILLAATKNGVDLPYSCLSGICTTCAGHCSEGKVEMFTQQGILDSDTGVGLVLTCVGYPVTNKVIMRIP